MTASTTPVLVWHQTDGTSTEFALDKESLLVGRGEEVDIRIDEPLVSREHARLERRQAGFRVVDLGSMNLTKVNGEPVRQRFLSDGDELNFARARCVFRESGSTATEQADAVPEQQTGTQPGHVDAAPEHADGALQTPATAPEQTDVAPEQTERSGSE